jgi:hypothetical protein
LKTGLRRLTKSRNRLASTCASRNARGGGVFVRSRSSTSTPSSTRTRLAWRHVVHVGFQ